MSARHNYDPRGEFQSIGRCPRCDSVVQRADLVHDGLLRPRTASRGGPYYLLSCASCGTRLVVEKSGPTAAYRLRTEHELPRTSPLRRILAQFLGGSSRRSRLRIQPARPTHYRSKPTPASAAPGAQRRRWTEAQLRALEVLGLDESATILAVKHAYRALARKLHPDAHPDATESQRTEWSHRFARATDAYRLLTARATPS